jgi:predicted alpha/beta superfamily hydrolase
MSKCIHAFALLLCIPCSMYSAMTIQITSWPQLTPMLDTIYLAGDFNNWNEGDPAFKMIEQNNVFTIEIEGVENQSIEFKFTRGSWSSVEGNNLGSYIANRTATFHNNTVLALSVSGWEDLAGAHTITENVRLLDSNFDMPQLNRKRRIWIYLPNNYDSSNTHYPVIYFHDGQNVFDNATSFSGEWQLDETLENNMIAGCNEVIVVAIDNGGVSRIDEYAPWINTAYDEGGEGIAYATFVVETLKPLIDQNFRTLPDRQNTCTAGSSLGALIAMYLFTEHNDVFSKAGIFSPAFWFNEEIYTLAENSTFDSNSELYFVCGDNESADMVNDMEQMRDIVMANGIAETNVNYSVQNGGTHSEYWWRQYFPGMYQSMYTCASSMVNSNEENELRIYPNPVNDLIQFSESLEQLFEIQIRDSAGKEIIIQTKLTNRALDVSALKAGMYTMTCSFTNETSGSIIKRSISFIKN